MRYSGSNGKSKHRGSVAVPTFHAFLCFRPRALRAMNVLLSALCTLSLPSANYFPQAIVVEHEVFVAHHHSSGQRPSLISRTWNIDTTAIPFESLTEVTESFLLSADSTSPERSRQQFTTTKKRNAPIASNRRRAIQPRCHQGRQAPACSNLLELPLASLASDC